MRLERAVASDPAFAAHVRGLVAPAGRSGSVKQISSYLDPGGNILVSADRHATVLPVVVAAPEDERIADLMSVVERTDGGEGSRRTSPAPTHLIVTSPSCRRAT